MTQDLSGFSKRELQSELASKQNEDWYFMIDSEEDPDSPDFLLVHKRYWHLHHGLDARHMSKLVTMPDGFGEAMDSVFEYTGSTEEGANSLLEYGFTELTTPYERKVIFYSPMKKRGPILSFTPDSAGIKELTEKWIKSSLPREAEKLPEDWNKQNYIAKAEEFARNNNLVAIVTSGGWEREGIWTSAEIAILSEAVAKSLPEYPENYDDFHMKP
jgi:hypothetical protein